MESIPFDDVHTIARQMMLLNVQLCVYLCCKGLNYAARSVFRRDPPKKTTRSANGRGVMRPNSTGQE